MTAREHNKLLSIFYFVLAGLQVVVGIFIALVYGIVGGAALSAGRTDEDQMLGGIFLGLALVIGIVMFAIGGFTLLTAFKVLKERPIGRVLGIVVSILVLFSIPLGTALGIYGLWFFFGEMGKNFYSGLSATGYAPPSSPSPPSPNSWQ